MKWIKFSEKRPKHNSMIILYGTVEKSPEGYCIIEFDSHLEIQETGICCKCQIRTEDIKYWMYLPLLEEENEMD